MAALLANINMFALLLYQSNLPLLGNQWWIGDYSALSQGSTQAVAGGTWYLSNPNGVQTWLMPIMSGGAGYTHTPLQYAIKTIVYLLVLIGGSVLFAKFWIETTDMGPTAVARQIQDSGMQIPGFRRDPRVLSKVLERYIPVVTVLGAIAVGTIASFADFFGVFGSGVGVLLTVGVLYKEDFGVPVSLNIPTWKRFWKAATSISTSPKSLRSLAANPPV
jgi:preprotein translocase subunit SecY